MDKEARSPSRAEWTEFSRGIQEDVNETLAELAFDIEVINAKLNNPEEEDKGKLLQIAQSAIEFLDSKWGYMRDIFMVAGHWHYPTGIEVSATGISVQHEKMEVFGAAKSNGLSVMPVDIDGEKQARVGLSFIVHNQSVSTSSMQGKFHVLAFAEPHEVTIQFMRPESPAVVSSSIDEVAQALATADALLLAHLNHEGTTFYRQTAKKQSAFLQNVIDSVERVLPAPDSGDKLDLSGAEIAQFFYRDPRNGELKVSLRSEANDGYGYVISGDIIGVTLFDTLQNGPEHAYSSPEEMSAALTGLCLIVRLRKSNFDIYEHEDNISDEDRKTAPDLIIPIRAIKDPEITLV